MKGFQPDVLGLFEEVLNNGTDLRVGVTGRSMMPFLRGGEVLTIRRMPRIIQKRKSGDGTFRFLAKRMLGKVLRIERPLLSGKTRHIDMNSISYRGMNFLIAVLGFLKAQTYFFLSSAIAKRT